MSILDKLKFWKKPEKLPEVEQVAPTFHEFKNINQQRVEPEATYQLVGGKIVITGYNQKFVDELRSKLGDISDGKTDEEIIQIHLDRQNLEREEPKLEVVHMGMNPDGTVKMHLDWNRAFILHLNENGITGETDEEAVELYLQLLHNEKKVEVTEEGVMEAFSELDAQLSQEFREAEEQIRNASKPKRRRRVDRH